MSDAFKVTDSMIEAYIASGDEPDVADNNENIRRRLTAVLAVVQAEQVQQTWINAFACVNPKDELALDLGKSVIYSLMHEGRDKEEPLDPYKQIVLRVICS